MLTLKTDSLELRGVKDVVSKKGSIYYLIHCESADGEPHRFIARDSSVFPNGLKKGEMVVLTVGYNSFKDLQVLKVERGVV